MAAGSKSVIPLTLKGLTDAADYEVTFFYDQGAKKPSNVLTLLSSLQISGHASQLYSERRQDETNVMQTIRRMYQTSRQRTGNGRLRRNAVTHPTPESDSAALIEYLANELEKIGIIDKWEAVRQRVPSVSTDISEGYVSSAVGSIVTAQRSGNTQLQTLGRRWRGDLLNDFRVHFNDLSGLEAAVILLSVRGDSVFILDARDEDVVAFIIGSYAGNLSEQRVEVNAENTQGLLDRRHLQFVLLPTGLALLNRRGTAIPEHLETRLEVAEVAEVQQENPEKDLQVCQEACRCGEGRVPVRHGGFNGNNDTENKWGSRYQYGKAIKDSKLPKEFITTHDS